MKRTRRASSGSSLTEASSTGTPACKVTTAFIDPSLPVLDVPSWAAARCQKGKPNGSLGSDAPDKNALDWFLRIPMAGSLGLLLLPVPKSTLRRQSQTQLTV
jgi:hypothetical protein